MMSDTRSPSQRPVSVSTATTSYVDWPAILGGSVFALALSFLLISFGTGLGLSLSSPYRGEGISMRWFAIASGIWLAWVTVTAFGAGGYLAGRMRRRAGDATATEVEARDGGHGLLVWATGAVVAMVLAGMGVGGLLAAGGDAVGKATDVVTEAASSDYFANVMLRAAPLDAQAASPTTPAAADPAIQTEVAAILTRSALEGEMADRDRSYLGQIVAANSGLDENAALARIDAVNAEIAQARATAVAAVERARVVAVVFGFITAATLLIGAVAAFFAAVAGGRHRDDGLGMSFLQSRY